MIAGNNQVIAVGGYVELQPAIRTVREVIVGRNELPISMAHGQHGVQPRVQCAPGVHADQDGLAFLGRKHEAIAVLVGIHRATDGRRELDTGGLWIGVVRFDFMRNVAGG